MQAAATGSLARLSPRKRPIAERRLKTLTDLVPDEVATGLGGFSGCWAFGFRDAQIVVLESLTNWKQVSSLSKAEILNAELHKHRLVHAKGWTERIREIVASSRPSGKVAA